MSQSQPTSATAADATPGQAFLDRALFRGIAWTASARWLTQVFSWASTLIVARLLTPRDYGLMGMATLYLGVVQLVNEFGLTAALVQVPNLDERARATIGGLAVVLGFVFFGLSAVVAGPMAEFFSEPAVRYIIMVLAGNFIITGFRVLPYSLISRSLDFRRLAAIDATGALMQTVATIVLAAVGFRYWSLVLGSVLSALTTTAMALIARPHGLAWPRHLGRVVDSVTLGWHLTVSRIAWYVYSNADFAVVGRVLGSSPLGAYTFGWQIASVPVDKVSGVLGQVLLPVFAKVQGDPPALARYVKGLTETLAIVTFPLAFGLALVGDNFVLFALGPHWRAAIGPLRLLAVYAGFRSLMTILPQALVATGRARWTMWLNLALALVMPASFYIAAHWGTSGVAMAWIIAYPIPVVPMLIMYTLRVIDLPVRDYLRALWPASSGVLVMTVSVLAVGRLLPTRWPAGVSLVALTSVGALTYVGVLWYGHRDRIEAVLALVRKQRQPSAPSTGPAGVAS